jgi:hypothetical protein
LVDSVDWVDCLGTLNYSAAQANRNHDAPLLNFVDFKELLAINIIKHALISN